MTTEETKIEKKEPRKRVRRKRTPRKAREEKQQTVPHSSPSLSREILVNVNRDETRVALVEEGVVVEYYSEKPEEHLDAGSVYLGKVMNVLPGMQAAFIDIGEEKNAFLYVDDALLPPNLDNLEGIPRRRRKKTIGELVKMGETVMVQVVKEAMGTKGPRVTRHVTLPGRDLVLMPTVNYVGVSRRIADDDERQRLRKLAKGIKPKNMGLIIRTAAEGKSEDELKGDLEFLVKLWEQIRAKGKGGKVPSLVHRDLGLALRVVRDELNQDTTRILLDDAGVYAKVNELLNAVSPEMKDKVVFYQDREYPLFDLYGVEAAIDKALSRQVWLKSGGYIVIDKTEALTAIDVNTGRYVGGRNLGETVFKINMEASAEIVRQLRLRDIGGIIIIDFIDMDKKDEREKLIAELKANLQKDHTKTVVVGMTGLGLIEMTRKNVRQSLDATLSRMCPYCGGKGTVVSEETMANRVRREIRRVLGNSHSEAILVEVNPGVASYLIGPGGANLKELEKETGRNIFAKGNGELHIEEINVKALGTKEEISKKALPVQEGQILEIVIEEPHSQNGKDGISRIEGYVLDVQGAGDKVGQRIKVEVTDCSRTFAKAKVL